MAKVIPDNIFTQDDDKPKETKPPLKKKQLKFKHLNKEAQEFMKVLEWLSTVYQTGSATTDSQ